MDDKSYNVDDILSEVKKRREENEQRVKKDIARSTEKSPVQTHNAVSKADAVNKRSAVSPNKSSAPQVNAKRKPPVKKTPPVSSRQQAQNKSHTAAREEAGRSAAQNRKVYKNTALNNANSADNGEMVNLFSIAADDNNVQPAENKRSKSQKPQADPWRKTKKGKITITIIILLVVLIAGAGVYLACYFNGALNKVTDGGEDYQTEQTYDGMDFLKEDFPTINEIDSSDAESYRAYLKQWYENGDPVSSTHVKNVLLIGEDTHEEEIKDASRADSAIIASINIDTKQITLTSVLRDLYVYFEVDGKGQYGKINAAASTGGMKNYIKTVERYYKIQIENYAVVNFASFPDIIDTLGGVSINITSAEIYEINNHQKRYGNVTIKKTFDGNEGKMKLDGKQALAYCRIRKIDSDGARADRQKTVLLQLFNQIKKSSNVDSIKVINDLVPYVYTGYSKKEIVSIGKYAFSQGWLGFDTQTTTVPSEENAKGGEFRTSSGGYLYGGWIWKGDIPKDAYDLQMKIYGKSNIRLNENRAKYVDLI